MPRIISNSNVAVPSCLLTRKSISDFPTQHKAYLPFPFRLTETKRPRETLEPALVRIAIANELLTKGRNVYTTALSMYDR